MASYTSVHQLYAAATSTGGDAVASLIVPVASRIVAIRCILTAAAAGAIQRAEISLQSTNQFTTNDARQVVHSVMLDIGAGQGDVASFPQVLCDVPVTEMDRIYAHVLMTSAAWRLQCLIWLRHG